ncbi:MAG: 2-hydroxyacyl-CoA dehydratase family protein [Acetivibrio sp.]
MSAKQLLNELLDKHYEDAWMARRQGIPVGWVSSNFPQEFLETMDLTVCYPENHSTSLSAKHESMKMIERTERQGYSNDICGYARVNLGYLEDGVCESLNMPLPDFVVCTNNICTEMIKWFENVANIRKIPMIIFDIPFNTEYEVSESRLEYMRNQIPELIEKLEKIAGKKWNAKRFEEVMKISNECGRQWQRASGYFESNPSPINGFEMFNYMALMVCARGKKETVEAIKMLADEMEERCKKGETTFKGEAKHRIMMEGIACWPHLQHNYQTLKNHGCNLCGTVYTETWGRTYKNLDEMLKSYSTVLDNTNLERSCDRRINLAKRTECDGVIMHLNRSCKAWDGILYEMERRVRENADLPTTLYNGDQSDPRCYTEQQYETRVEGLSEIMDERKNGK